MLRLSTLLSKLDFSTMGDLRADLVGEAERLEGVEEVREAINRECEKADAAPVKELLKYDNNGSGLHVIIDNATKLILGQATNQGAAERLAAGLPTPCSVVRVLAPDDTGNCPTQYIDGEYEWAVYFPEDELWAGESKTISYVPTTSFDDVIRFQSKADAMRFKTNKHLNPSAIPFPVPKIKEGK